MLDPFKAVKGQLKIRFDKASIDDVIFKLHYRATFMLLLVSSILVTQRQYVGEHIKCLSDLDTSEKKFINVINTYCFFSSTFTVVKHLNESALLTGNIPHPGVGPAVEEDEVIHHAYYQWVPFVLFAQALMFYLPHAIWKTKEDGRLQAFVSGLHLAFVPNYEEDQKKDDMIILSKKNIDNRIQELKIEYKNRFHAWRSWSVWLVSCEVLNLLNLMFQIYLTDVFLGGYFWGIGSQVWNNVDWDDYLDPLDVVFPKVTKCVFYKYGPSGVIQNNDAMCVMALNVIHEKIFTILWFWYAIVFIFTVLGLIHRFLVFILFPRSVGFNHFMFKYACPGNYKSQTLNIIRRNCYFGDWLFLYYLGKNMRVYVFKMFLKGVAEDFDQYYATPLKMRLGKFVTVVNNSLWELLASFFL
ncbi:innexin inx7-like [Arctopsyche grandis]|uniref:innexin inx7-like n=1 Tax=Arctopsyche grandis TaxID=121162 RepID=UPI00406D93A1